MFCLLFVTFLKIWKLSVNIWHCWCLMCCFFIGNSFGKFLLHWSTNYFFSLRESVLILRIQSQEQNEPVQPMFKGWERLGMVPRLQIQFKLNKAVYKQIMWIAVRQAHLSVALALWGPNKLTHPFKGPSSAKVILNLKIKRPEVLVMLGNSKTLILYKLSDYLERKEN